MGYLPNTLARRRFAALAIYNCIQSVAIYPQNSPKYDEVRKYSKILENHILPKLFLSKKHFPSNSFEKKSFYEIIEISLLKFVYFINKLLSLKSNNKKGIILCYHTIGNEEWKYTVALNEFKKQFNYIRKNFQFSTLSEIISKKDILNKVALTFDDGYLNIYTNVLPILDNYGIKATVFVLGNESKANRNELGNNFKLMNLDQLKDLHSRGWEIGFHTNTHSNLADLSEDELIEEIIIGKKNLEKKLGFKINYFAYPKGKYTSIILDIVEKACFNAAFTVEGGNINFNNLNLLTRTQVAKNTNMQQFSTMLSPLGLFTEDLLLLVLNMKVKAGLI